MTLEQHLAWLLYLMEEHPEGWKQHCWHRAKELAAERPELADLPRMLTERMSAQSSPSAGSDTADSSSTPTSPKP